MLLLIGLAAIALLSACADDDSSSNPSAQPGTATQATAIPSPTGPTPTRTPVNVPITEEVTVFAASSLTDAFTEIGADYEATFPGVKVTFNFGGSQDLRTQLEQGAAADVFASADTAHMDAAATSGLVTGLRRVFAHNKLAIIVPKDNEAGISTPQDLARDDIKILIAGENVPVGRYTRQFLDAASAMTAFGAGYKDAVLSNVVSEASNVREVAAAVQLDEVDAGIVYITDVPYATSGDVTMVEIPDDVNQTADYPISLTYSADADDVAQGFIDYVLSEMGQAVLESFGFIRADQ
jgi:molybdate transport system substrate-binding protein